MNDQVEILTAVAADLRSRAKNPPTLLWPEGCPEGCSAHEDVWKRVAWLASGFASHLEDIAFELRKLQVVNDALAERAVNADSGLRLVPITQQKDSL